MAFGDPQLHGGNRRSNDFVVGCAGLPHGLQVSTAREFGLAPRAFRPQCFTLRLNQRREGWATRKIKGVGQGRLKGVATHLFALCSPLFWIH